MKTILRTILKGVLTVCMAAVLLFPVRAAATEVGQPGDNIASGTVDGITWVIDAEGKLTITGTGDLPDEYRGWTQYDPETGATHSRMPWGAYDGQITSAKIDVSGMTNSSYLFNNCSNLMSVDMSGFDTSLVTDMKEMFEGCRSLKSLDLRGFDTSQVTDMSHMFYSCESLTSLDLSGFDTRQVTDMGFMFSYCGGLTSLNVSSFNTSQVTNMANMFDGCSSLTSLDVSGFDTRQVTIMTAMFYECSSLTSLDISGFNTSQVTKMVEMFWNCRGLTSLNVSGFDTSHVTNMEGMFYGCSGLTNLDVSGFDTSQVTDMSAMFCSCNSLTSLDVSGFKTDQVTYMDDMFNGCSSLTSLDLSGFDMSRVIDGVDYIFSGMVNTFTGCSSLTSLNTPLNVQVSALLPEVEGLSWHMPDGTVVTELPQNLDYSVLLTRDVAAPEITTTTADLNMEDVIRVQYVPYSYTMETSNQDPENTVTFSIEKGDLPEGLMIYPATGEIYGVPMEVGEFPLTIKATFSNEQYLPSYAEITLTVLENTAENIAKATEPGYEITQPVTDLSLEGMDEEGTQTLVSQGEFAQFKDVYLDGRKLIRDVEYTAVEGSTRITIKNQTLGNAGVGTHTLGIEFRTEEGTLKRAAQNYTVSKTSAGSGSTGQPGGSQSSSGGSGNQSGSQSGAAASTGSGNSNNSASTQATAVETQMTEIIYTVQPGDSLWKIAAKYRRQGVTWQRIYADNRNVIRNPGLIFAGQQLRICFAVTEEAETPAAGTLSTYSEKYSVRQGDTLWGIAVKTYGDGRLWTRIYEANRDVLENPDRLRIGQLLTIYAAN